MIGIIGAMGIEVRSLAEILENKKCTTISGIDFLSGTIYGKDVVLAVCGVGKVFAAVCTQTMILNFSPDVIINTGVAGTLTDKLSIGDVAVSENVVQHDMDTTPLGDPPGLVSGINIVKIPANDELRQKLVSAIKNQKVNYLEGTIASGDQFLASGEVKDRVVKNFGAIACEMEGASVGLVCHIGCVPFCVLRAISDCADGHGAENYFEFLEKAAYSAVEVMKDFIREY